MGEVIQIGFGDIAREALRTAQVITREQPQEEYRLYGVPRGGIAPAYAVAAELQKLKYDGQFISAVVTGDPNDADVIVDDLRDSGATMLRHVNNYGCMFVWLFDKQGEYKNKWLVFPWEITEEKSIEDNITRLLQFVGEDPSRGGLKDTPSRVAKAWQHWCGGYQLKPADVLKVFEDGADKYDEMVTVARIPFYSHCEHHLAPFFGTATVSYIPNGKIVGISKLSRLVDLFARRLQVQERLTTEIADAMSVLEPKGVGVQLKARHLCMESRGVQQQGQETVTTALRGVMRTDPAARSEFLKGL